MVDLEESLGGELERGERLCDGRYTILRRISRGGVASVYEAVGPSGRSVALKVMASKRVLQGVHVARLENEMRIGALLVDIPTVVRPLEQGTIPELGERPFIAFEFEGARDLSHLIRESSTGLEPLLACEITRVVADTLVVLHRRGVVHRDIKPRNILVDVADGVRVRLIDFGFAHSLGVGSMPDTTGLTKTFEITGTVHYMAPEHCMGAPASPAFDIYGLASSLWEMVMGFGPYYGHDRKEVLRRKLKPSCPVPSISNGLREVDSELAALIEWGMRWEPEKRIPSAEVFRDELDRIIARLSGRRGLTLPSVTAVIDEVHSRGRWPTMIAVGSAVMLGLGLVSFARSLPVGDVVQTEVEEEPRLGVTVKGAAAVDPDLVDEPRPVLEADVERGFELKVDVAGNSDLEADVGSSGFEGALKSVVDVVPAEALRRESSSAKVPSPVRGRRPAGRPSRKPVPKEVTCDELRSWEDGHRRKARWSKVLETLDVRPDCWNEKEEIRLRMRALSRLGRFQECVQVAEAHSREGTRCRRLAD